jgi:uncharacterized membrane protein YgdD (TMEM256/DUF423 family)
VSDAARFVALAAALLSLSAIVLAAMGSHMIPMNGMQASWQVASKIHLFSAATLFGLAGLLSRFPSALLNWGSWLVVLGTVVFCGNIYLHVISGYTLPKVTPLGGFIMMTGWLVVALAFVRKP